jgi:hypothetical protein
METNYLQASLKALGDQIDTCKLCGAIVNRDFREVHDRVHRGNYEPFSVVAIDTRVDTCRLCGAIVNPDFREVHDRTHA